MGIIFKRFCFLISGILNLSFTALAKSADKRVQIATQFLSLAPNAGGQEVFSLRAARENWELSLFSNQTIYAGEYPYSGCVLHRRFPVCDASCFWQFYTAVGGGVSNGGPIMEFTWSTIIPLIPIWLPLQAPSYYPAVRLDVTTQIVLIQWRAVTWNYPFWIGISVPI